MAKKKDEAVKPKKAAKPKAKPKAKEKAKPAAKAKNMAGPSDDSQKERDIPGAKSANGTQTTETRILACQCGSTGFEVKKRTRTSVSLVCGKCGLRCSVKGNLATVRVQQQEILYALANTVVTPDDSPDNDDGPAPGEKVGDGTGGLGAEYVTLRFRIMKGDQKDVIDRAMEAVRVANCAEDRFREQTWQGHALEWICADFLAGCSHDVLQIVDAMDAAVEDAVRIAAEDGKSEPPARKIRDLRARVRDKLAAESGLLPVEMMGDDARQLDLIDGDDTDIDDGDDIGPVEDVSDDETDDTQTGDDGAVDVEPVIDGGRLMRAVQTTLEGYLNDAVGAGIEDDGLPEFVIRDVAVPSIDLIEKWTTSGGYLVRILGDPRTIGEDGKRASICAWIAAEPAELALDFSIEYDDATDDILGDGAVEVIELLPPDYDEIDKWAAPHFADRREKL